MKKLILLFFLLIFVCSALFSKTITRIEAIYNEDNTKQSVFYKNAPGLTYYDEVESIIKRNIDLICYYNDDTKEIINDGKNIELVYDDIHIGLNEIKVFYGKNMTRIIVPVSNQKESFSSLNNILTGFSIEKSGAFLRGVYDDTENNIVVVPKYINENQIKRIGTSAFENSNTLKEIYLPRDLTYIDDKAFLECWRLEKINIPDTVIFIGKEAFSRCNRLKEINLPNGLSSISDETFSFCYDLKKVYFSESIKNIGERAFYKCSNLQKILEHSSVETIGNQAFFECEELYRVFVTNAKFIGYQAFKNCTKLYDVGLYYRVNLGEEAFFDIKKDVTFSIFSDEDTPLHKITAFEEYLKKYCNNEDIDFIY